MSIQTYQKQSLLTLTILSACLMLPALYSSCSPLPDYRPPTISEQVNNAGSIFAGRVKKIITVVPYQTWTVILEKYRILKRGELTRRGWQPRYLEISGFAGASLCGPAAPNVGDEIVVFVCPNKDKSTWRTPKRKRYWGKRYWSLNKFVIGSGMINLKNDRSLFKKIRRLAKKSRKSGHCTSEREFVYEKFPVETY
jgi:hypothetical protein